MRRRAALAVLALALPVVGGCNDGAPPSAPPAPARAPRPPADEIDAALAGSDVLALMLHSWRADIASEPLPDWEVA